ncbi:MAG: 2-oxoacid:acceptor oxidoreductase family protein, partial [Proteobacteria bacterium]|nr:2-oxoacid:acceptor oxidoreductase family protein [Pseudomonadota bacterium]
GKLITLNANALAEKAGNTMAVNMVLLGALISTRILPLSLEAVKQAIADKTRKAFVDVNLRAFDMGYEAAGKTG